MQTGGPARALGIKATPAMAVSLAKVVIGKRKTMRDLGHVLEAT